MASDAERSPLPPPMQDVDSGLPGDAPNIFAPISTENRITGTTRIRKIKVPAQLAPGSAYDYGSGYGYDTAGSAAPEMPAGITALPDDSLFGYQKSMPPDFLHRTMVDSSSAQSPDFTSFNTPVISPLEAYRQAGAPHNPLPPSSVQHQPNALQGADDPATFSGGVSMDAAYDWTRPYKPVRTAPASAPYKPLPVSKSNAGSTGATPSPATNSHDDNGWTSSYSPISAAPYSLGDSMPASQYPATTAAVPANPHDANYPGAATAASYGYTIPYPAIRQSEAVPLATPTPKAKIPAKKPVPARENYVPRHGRVQAKQVPEAPAPVTPPPVQTAAPQPSSDPWELMGWKSPDNSPLSTAPAWQMGNVSMFERSAFEEPLDPLRNPAEGFSPQYGAVYPGVPSAVDWQQTAVYTPNYLSGTVYATDTYPTYKGTSAQSYAPYAADTYPAHGANTPYADYAYDDSLYPVYEQEAPVPYVPKTRPASPARPAKSAPSKRTVHFDISHIGLSLSKMGPLRASLLIGSTVALLIGGIEASKIVISLIQNEQEVKKTRDQYYAMAGVEPGGRANAVELLPPGQTFAPTATPVALTTPVQNQQQNVASNDGNSPQTTFQAALPTPTPIVRTKLTSYPDNTLLTISEDFAALRSENADIVARLTIEGLLEETVVKRNNTFYLTHNASGVFGSLGAVFVDEGCVLEKPPENLLLRGQTSVPNKLFQPLLRYATEGADFVRQHGIITCDTVYEKATYVVFAVIAADNRADSPQYFNYAAYTSFQSDTQMLRYVEAAKQRSIYQIDVNVREDDRLLTLSTIADGNSTTNLVLLCRMLRSGESASSIQTN